jgi:carboxymethylenebutenolidase
MTTTKISARVADGTALGELSVPDTTAARLPLVVLYPDAGGIRPAMRHNAERFAAGGFAVLDVEIFWRSMPFAPFDFHTVWTDAKERPRLFALLSSVVPDNVFADTRALIATLDGERIDTSRFATVGYCIGGRLAFLAAAAMNDRVVAAAPIHAGGLVTPAADSPHRQAGSIRAALYLGVADQDNSCTAEHQEALRQALGAAGVSYELDFNPGARHGYAVSDFPVFDAAADARHAEKAIALFRAHV